MGWGCGSSGRVPTWQARAPKFKTSVLKRRRKKILQYQRGRTLKAEFSQWVGKTNIQTSLVYLNKFHQANGIQDPASSFCHSNYNKQRMIAR
jgi:hypothetical protein